MDPPPFVCARASAACAGLYSVRMAGPRPGCPKMQKRPAAPHDGDATGRVSRQPSGRDTVST
ncbi:hypothetical protein BSLA_01r2063 [Burkholderia stabilis]|nr:hypothetical protein BSLA_01r2063 [Burkholderia stabilis]